MNENKFLKNYDILKHEPYNMRMRGEGSTYHLELLTLFIRSFKRTLRLTNTNLDMTGQEKNFNLIIPIFLSFYSSY